MKILISGSSGLVGKSLRASLEKMGHDVYALKRVRAAASENSLFWDPTNGTIDDLNLISPDVIIHLAGENIAGRRWSPEFKEKIRKSRVEGSKLLVKAINKLERPIKVLISASAVGIYGDRGNEILNEDSPPGNGFLSDTCKEWESTLDKILNEKIRVVTLRIGMVLSEEGGALTKMLPIFKLGLGTPLGSGKQYISWIHLADLVAAIEFCIDNPLSGPVNAASPNPVTNHDFTKALCRALGKPCLLPKAPAFALKLVMGEMAEALVLNGQRVQPNKLHEYGFKFKYPVLDLALESFFPSNR